MTQASVGWHCPTCVSGYQKQARPAQKAVQRAFAGHPPTVTKLLIAASVAVFGYDLLQGANPINGASSTVARDLSLFAPSVEFSDEWYRIGTSAFAHSGLIHIGFNMWLLWVIGQTLEGRFGSLTFASMYTTGILGGALGAMLIEPRASVVGASGAVFALMGVLLVLQRMGGVNVFQSGIGGLVLINVMLSFRSGISLGGHLGGLAVGVVMGLMLGYARERGSKALALVPIGIAGLGLLVMLGLIPVIDRAAGMFI